MTLCRGGSVERRRDASALGRARAGDRRSSSEPHSLSPRSGSTYRARRAALVSGSFGSWYAFGSGTLVRATPLILTGLAVAIAFRSGVFNIGAEGQFLTGAAAASAIALAGAATHLPAWALIVGLLLGGGLAGAAWAWIAAELRARFHVLEVISTIMLNFVAAYLVSYLVRGPLQEPTHIYPQTETFAMAAQLPRFGTSTRLHAGFAIACVACVVCWWVMRYTAAGFRLRVVGANPDAAQIRGWNRRATCHDARVRPERRARGARRGDRGIGRHVRACTRTSRRGSATRRSRWRFWRD